MEETELNYIRMINAGERFVVNNQRFGYLYNRILFYLTNLHIKSRQTYFARAGTSTDDGSAKSDPSLSEAGQAYATKLGETLLRHREDERKSLIERGGSSAPLKKLSIWTSTRRRTIETANFLADQGFAVRQRSQMSQMNPGVCEKMTEEEIREAYPDEVEKHTSDPYHHRYPRAEVSGIVYLSGYSS
jgi:broad specificity phosphatase PhoE